MPYDMSTREYFFINKPFLILLCPKFKSGMKTHKKSTYKDQTGNSGNRNPSLVKVDKSVRSYSSQHQVIDVTHRVVVPTQLNPCVLICRDNLRQENFNIERKFWFSSELHDFPESFVKYCNQRFGFE